MPNSKRKRTHVEMDGKASSRKRREAQGILAAVNADIRQHRVPGDNALTPWETSKQKRALNRRRAGKTFKNWVKNNPQAQSNQSPVNAGTLSK